MSLILGHQDGFTSRAEGLGRASSRTLKTLVKLHQVGVPRTGGPIGWQLNKFLCGRRVPLQTVQCYSNTTQHTGGLSAVT